jgi:hypothetical protein
MERSKFVYAFVEAITATVDASSFCLSTGKVGIPPAVIEPHLVNAGGQLKSRQIAPTPGVRELKAQTIVHAPETHGVRGGLNSFPTNLLPSRAIHL